MADIHAPAERDCDGMATLDVRVTCPRERYWRAGIFFTRGKHTVQATRAQLDTLQEDPCLHVELLATPPQPDDAAASLVDLAGDAGDVLTPAQIRAAVAQLDRNSREHFTADGNPRVAAVSAVLGRRISGTELAAALKGGE
ncbi:hypothetical protein FUA39_02110 [Salmonella enterica]|uniref:Uncharacterized protein n=1 Tax=Salmonella enterica TaxID=28901 RepID=A0A747DDI9_SALER|nr:HI1506-related protein [Salmonella enterica]EDX3295301.1 hypothetical protein [Salmonella enterica subsp. enterica serovar Irumu]EEB7847417.1 hypothetical protein [Salmonella enterica subsp. enterica serovar Agona]EEJ3619817.1 hypothetical protein [Salmonella enterica subsp. enterica]EHH2059668.1 hypothetical protein [Salmonella enterica subsp. enterica serovar Oranienburg]EAT8528743.1 hypothetical protein [Salmonella enterica]